ncbi:MAG TPA: tetratricopeptide repeat protein, partial [Steroidobacteraceae bacterium]|nr:tetratricopeptide repeat protein [Steroidobacteraceae bacterium]
FVASIFREASPYSGTGTTSLSAVDLLKQAEKKLGSGFADQPGVRIELLALIGESLLALGDLDAAEPMLDRAANEARQALDDRDAMAIRVSLLQAQLHLMRGRAKQARAEFDRILPLMRSDPKIDPLDLAGALGNRTMLAIEEGAYDDAERFALEGARLATAKLGKDNDQTVTSSILLALAYRYTKKFEQSRDAAKDAYLAALAHFGATPPHARVIEAKTTYGRALADTGDLPAGIALIDSAVVDIRALTGSESFLLGTILQNLVAYRIDHGELALADGNATEALKVLGAQVQVESVTYAGTLSARAQARLARRDVAAALDDLDRVVPILERLLGGEREMTLLARSAKALALAYLGRLGDAQVEIEAAAKIATGKKDLEVVAARIAQVRGTIARLRGDLGAALHWQQAVSTSTDARPKLRRERMRALAEIGLIRLDMDEAAPAAAALEQSLEEFERLEARVTPAHADALVGLGRARLAQGRATDALPSLEIAHGFWRDFAPASRWAGEAALWLGQCYLSLDRNAEAREALSRAENLLEASPIPADAKLLELARIRG